MTARTEHIQLRTVLLGNGKKMGANPPPSALLPERSKIDSCLSCGTCSSGCPASNLADMDPRRFVRMAAMGMDQEIFDSKWVWVCTMCNRCAHVCPMQIDIPGLIFFYRKHWPEKDKPQSMQALCEKAVSSGTSASTGMDADDFRFVVENVADDVRQDDPGFENLHVPVDKKGARFFVNQISSSPATAPGEMAPLWKILHLAGIDWTYSSRSWAAENGCMFLGRENAWKKLVEKKANAVERLGCDVLLSTECGHDFYAVKQGLQKFSIPHRFQVSNIVEYYARWIRNGRLKINSDWNLDLKIRFTVQDPCQLIRKSHGDTISEDLRFVVKTAVGEENFIDMSPSRSNNYCCGGGGGTLQSDDKDARMAYGKIKFEQILETRAAYCITPCNNCHRQIRDLAGHFHADFRSVHLWTILCLAMGVLGKNERKDLGSDLAGMMLPAAIRKSIP